MKTISKTRNALCGFTSGLLLLAAGTAQTHAGTIVAWGSDNFAGQHVSNVPTGDDFVGISSVTHHAFALRADGSIAGWGYDDDGRVSNGLPTDTGYTKVWATNAGGLALRADGSIKAWGNDVLGFVSNAPTGTGFTDIVGTGFCYALRTDGSIAAWGNWDDFGQVSNTPTGTGYKAIWASGYTGFALTADGHVDAWGNDDFGQISWKPTDGGYTALGGTHATMLALSANGTIYDWGGGSNVADGALASPISSPNTWPTGFDGYGLASKTMFGSGYTAVAPGSNQYGMALTADGHIKTWTDNDQWGVVANTPTVGGFTAIAGGYATAYGLLEISAVPEVSAVPVLGFALLGFGLTRRQRRA